MLTSSLKEAASNALTGLPNRRALIHPICRGIAIPPSHVRRWAQTWYTSRVPPPSAGVNSASMRISAAAPQLIQ